MEKLWKFVKIREAELIGEVLEKHGFLRALRLPAKFVADAAGEAVAFQPTSEDHPVGDALENHSHLVRAHEMQ